MNRMMKKVHTLIGITLLFYNISVVRTCFALNPSRFQLTLEHKTLPFVSTRRGGGRNGVISSGVYYYVHENGRRGQGQELVVGGGGGDYQRLQQLTSNTILYASTRTSSTSSSGLNSSGSTKQRKKSNNNNKKKKRQRKNNYGNINTNRNLPTNINPNNNNNNNNTNQQHKQNKKQKVVMISTNEQIRQMSIGQAIQESTSIDQLLLITGERMWIPTDEDLPQHLRLQLIHHEKRFRSACLLLERLSEFIVRSVVGDDDGGIHEKRHSSIWTLSQFRRVVLAATLPFIKPSSSSSSSSDDNDNSNTTTQNQQNKRFFSGIDIEKECRFVTIALVSLHTIAGFTLPPCTQTTRGTNEQQQQQQASQVALATIDKDIIESIQTLVQRAERLSASSQLALNQAIEIRWAIRGLYQRIPDLISTSSIEVGTTSEDCDDNNNNNNNNGRICSMPPIPHLNKQVAKLPFDIIPNCIDWTRIQSGYHQHIIKQRNNHQNDSSDSSSNTTDDADNANNDDIIKTFLNEIPFNIDTITTRSGSLVQERRSTAWIAEDGIGSLAYSGKLMNPKPIPPIVQYTMREVEKSIIQHDDELERELLRDSMKSSSSMTNMDYQSQLKLCVEDNGKYFDCALTNHYPDFDSACKFHTDPEHGSFWERLTTVVSAGNDDIRKFAFRPIPQINDWSQWDGNNNNKSNKKGDGIEPAVIYLFPGDCVKMWGSCNDVFHHAVYGADAFDDANADLSSQPKRHNDGRVSLVFKRAMDRGNGRRGHGQRGEGRRSKRL